MPEYVVVAHNPDQSAVGDHINEIRKDAIDYAEQFLDEEKRTGASVTITVVTPYTDEDPTTRSGDDVE